jgi:spoIIIJ-associated protein
MTKKVNAKADSIEEAARRALRDIADGDVEVSLDASGVDLDAITFVRMELEYEEADDEDAAEDEDLEGEESDEADATEEDEEEDEGPAVTLDDLDEEADAAADFIEGLLDAIGLPGDIKIRVHEDHAEVEVVNIGTGQLIGRRGQTLDAIQELLRCAIQRQFERRCRVIIDIEGYRERRLEKLLDKARTAIDDALDSGEEQRLEPMDVHERKAIHRIVAEHDGVTSNSRGREPTRRVIIEKE